MTVDQGPGGHKERGALVGMGVSLMLNLLLFALAPLFLDQDVRTDRPVPESLDLRIPLRSKPLPEPETQPDPEPPVPLELLLTQPELPAPAEPPALKPPDLAASEAPPPVLMEAEPARAPSPKPAPAAPLPARPAKKAAVTVPVSGRSKGGASQAAPVAEAPKETGEGRRRYAMDQVDTVPSVVGQPRPDYPYRARRRNIEGWVKVRFLVDRDGRVHDLTILSSSPMDVFDAAVRQAVPRWRFKPGNRSGRPVDVWVETTIRFKLD